ncbi:uncharacterized protein LOC144548255 [Carex rostrata]
MATDRGWMYSQNSNGDLSPEFITGVIEFIESALSKPSVVRVDANGKQCISCPCQRCENLFNKDVDTVKLHLFQFGFCNLYHVWYKHGEPHPGANPLSPPTSIATDRMGELIRDAAGVDFDWNEVQPVGAAKKFFDMMQSSKTPLWKVNLTGELKCEKHSVLSVVTHAIALKSEFQLSQKCFDAIMGLMKSTLPDGEQMPDNFYQSKRFVEELGMAHVKIDVCPNFCTLYYNDVNKKKMFCDVCLQPRYKPSGPNKKAKPVPQKILRYLPITPRLQRMFMTEKSAQNMRWHKEGVRDKPGFMGHPADSEAW